MSQLLELMLTRRSDARLAAPGPTDKQLELVLQAATTVPDHGAMRPWRFVVVRGEAHEHFADALADAATRARPDAPPALVAEVRGKAFAAPVQVVLIARLRPEAKVEVWEQLASASCTGDAITLAAHALGIGAVWKSSAHHDGPLLRELFALQPDDQLLGWVNLGVALSVPEPRQAPALTGLAHALGADGTLTPFGSGASVAP